MMRRARGRNRPRVRLFCTDVDGTILGGTANIRRFTTAWQALPFATRPRLVYNSSRPAAEIRFDIATHRLPPGDYVIGGLGTELYDGHAGTLVAEFSARFETGWDQSAISAIVGKTPGVAPQGPENQLRRKSSWVWPQATDEKLAALRRRLAATGLRVRVIFSGGRLLDVVPAEGGKGAALRWLCRRLRVSLRAVAVAGDAGNDREMFQLAGVRQIVVANADADLRRVATRHRAVFARSTRTGGVIEGLREFSVLPATTTHRA